jgi:ABC-type enterochelin transport system permease subunit
MQTIQPLVAVFQPVLAAGGFQAGLSKALGLIMMIGFVYAVIKIIGGAASYNRDPDAAKQSIIGGLLIAGAVAIVTVLFQAFGLNVGITPDMGGF